MPSQVSFDMKISASDTKEQTRPAEELGIEAATVELRPVINWNSPLMMRAREENGKLIMPREWRDEDDEEDEEDY